MNKRDFEGSNCDLLSMTFQATFPFRERESKIKIKIKIK